MADKKISQLTAASTPLAGTEVLPIVQSGSTVKVASDDLTVKNVRSNATSGILQIAGPAAAATRTMTVPDANFTAARTDASQTFTGAQTFSSNPVLDGGTANGVLYLNASKAATSGTGLVFDGTNLGVGTSPSFSFHIRRAVAYPQQGMDAFGAGYFPIFNTRVSNNSTAGSFTATVNGNTLFDFRASGTNSGNSAFAQGASLEVLQTDTAGATYVPAAWLFKTSDGTNAPAERVRITSDGNLKISTAGKGIDFSANTGAAGMTSELLNWYEEGTWTPSVTSSGGTITSVTGAAGSYVRIGKIVFARGTFVISDNGTGSGSLTVSGLPFTVDVASPVQGYNSTDGITLGGNFAASSTVLGLVKVDGTYPGVTGSTYIFSGVYVV